MPVHQTAEPIQMSVAEYLNGNIEKSGVRPLPADYEKLPDALLLILCK